MAALLVVCLFALAYAVETTSYDVWAVFWVAPALILLTVPMANRSAQREGDPSIGRIILAAAALKVVVGSLARYWTEATVYGGGDSDKYHEAGVALAPLFRSGIYRELGEVSGTRFTDILTGHVYALIGPSRLGGYMVFSWLAFVGLYFFWRAFRRALPEGDHRRYLLLVLFFPTLFFWTSATGKDAWMVFCLGITAYGLALVMTSDYRGLIAAGLGLWGAGVVRPHLTLIVVVGLAVAAPIRVFFHRDQSRAGAGHGTRVLLVVFLVAAASLGIAQAETFFGLDQLDIETAEEVSERVTGTTTRGGSAFAAPDPRNPVGYVQAAVTVLFRPFPGEARNVQGLLTAAEGLVLLAAVFVSRKRLMRLPAALARQPYVMFALAYTGAFVFAFASINNFGILVRQRSQLLPVFFVLLALSARRQSVDTETASAIIPTPERHATRR